MKPPTKAELRKLAVAAYGKRAVVHVARDMARGCSDGSLSADEVTVYDRPGSPAARIALAAALRVLAEVRK